MRTNNLTLKGVKNEICIFSRKHSERGGVKSRATKIGRGGKCTKMSRLTTPNNVQF